MCTRLGSISDRWSSPPVVWLMMKCLWWPLFFCCTTDDNQKLGGLFLKGRFNYSVSHTPHWYTFSTKAVPVLVLDGEPVFFLSLFQQNTVLLNTEQNTEYCETNGNNKSTQSARLTKTYETQAMDVTKQQLKELNKDCRPWKKTLEEKEKLTF